MAIRLLSFDLQGTLSDFAFSKQVWLSLLPGEFAAQRSQMTKEEYAQLFADFRQVKEDDPRYYDIDYWLERCGSPLRSRSLAVHASLRPMLFPEMQQLVEEYRAQVAVILVSATTHTFIDIELGEWRPFDRIYSTFDDFRTAGKPSAVFTRIAREFNCDPRACLHIGDHPVFDGTNPGLAGWVTLYQPSHISPTERSHYVRYAINHFHCLENSRSRDLQVQQPSLLRMRP